MARDLLPNLDRPFPPVVATPGTFPGTLCNRIMHLREPHASSARDRRALEAAR